MCGIDSERIVRQKMHLGAKIVCVIKKAMEKSIAFLFIYIIGNILKFMLFYTQTKIT